MDLLSLMHNSNKILKLLKQIRGLYNHARNVRYSSIFQLISISLAILAALTAGDFFTSRPGLRIDIWSDKYYYRGASIHEFYMANNLDTTAFGRNFIQKHFKSPNDTLPTALINPFYVPNLDIIELIKQGYNIDYVLSSRILDLEIHFQDSVFIRHIYPLSIESILTRDQVQELIELIKNKYTKRDYYVFLTSLLYARQYTQNVWIKNIGSLELQNINIQIPAPLSRISGRREKTMIDYEVVGNIPYDIDKEEDRIKMFIPSLKKDQHLIIRITTRENRIVNKDLYYTYKDYYVLKAHKLVAYYIIILVFIAIIMYYFRGPNISFAKIGTPNTTDP